MWYYDPMLALAEPAWYAFCNVLIACGFKIEREDYFVYLALNPVHEILD